MEQRSDGRATHGAADGKAGVRRARRGIVLCGKYSSTLRKVQSCFPQGISQFAARLRPSGLFLRGGMPGRCAGSSDIIRYMLAVLSVVLLLLPAVVRTEAVPSVQDVWGHWAVAALCALAACTALWTALFRRCPAVRFHWMDAVATLWWLYVAAGYWLRPAFPASEAFGEATALWMAYAALRVVVPVCGRAWRPVWTCGLLTAGAWEALAGWRQLLGLAASHHHRFALTGTFFNPGPYGIFLALTLVVALAAARPWRPAGGAGRRAALCVAMLCLPVLVATWSRAAWAGAGVAVVLLLWQSGRRRAAGWTLAVGLAAGCAAYFLKQGSADGRVLMALVAGRAWAAEWLTGHGLGGYLPAYGEAQAAFFAGRPGSPLAAASGIPGYAFNALLGTGVEQGLVGALAAAAVCLWSLSALWRRADATACGWAVLLAASMFSYPFALWPFRLLAAGWVAGAVGGAAGSAGGRRARVGAGVVAAVLCVSAWGAAGMGQRAARVAAAYDDYGRLGGLPSAAFVDEFREMHDDLLENPDFLFSFGSALRAAGHYNESNVALREGLAVSCDPMFLVVMGNNYRDLGAAREAEAAYRKAWAMVPSRLYPLYRLMKFYEAEGRGDEAADAARRIVEARPKVDSPAVRDMKTDAERILAKKKEQP